jgi:hypothetical protein
MRWSLTEDQGASLPEPYRLREAGPGQCGERQPWTGGDLTHYSRAIPTLSSLKHGRSLLHESHDSFAKILRFAAVGDVAGLMFHLGFKGFVEAGIA